MEQFIDGNKKVLFGASADTITLTEARWAAATAVILGVIGGSKLARHNMRNGNEPIFGLIG